MTFTLFNASAGSGKTYNLTARLAQRIREGLDPSQLIATTFTIKAATELSQRVRATLLDEGMVEAARGIDSALIGTVNSVASQLVSDYALDAGISPDVQVLDETTQRSAFAAAIAEAAAAAGARHAGMLARTEHDGDDDPGALPGLRTRSWRTDVRSVADAARTNLMSAEWLRSCAEQSWLDYRSAAELPAPVADQRPRWLHELGQRIACLDDDLAQSVDADGEPIGGPIAKRSVNGVRDDIATLRGMHRRLQDLEHGPWSLWARLAKVAELDDKGKSRGSFRVDANAALMPLAQEIADGLPANPGWQQDVRDLITLVVTTAADSLDAYARYKRELGLIDFVDQEVQALTLLREHPRVRESVASRFHLLAVDEFQDTSPIQLALFLELSALIDDKIWVGDPKQAIYGFRDADPQLMQDVVAAIEGGGTGFGAGTVENLAHSWRSKEALVEFTNAVFTQVFTPSPADERGPAASSWRDRVTLSIPEQRREAAAGGCLEIWEADARTSTGTKRASGASQAKHAAMVADLLGERLRGGAFRPGDTAVLVRTNTEREAVVDALQARGIPTSGSSRPLLSTREGQIVRAALAIALDGDDTLALTELVTLLEDHAAHRTWFAELMAAPDRDARGAVFESWWQDPVLAGLRGVRQACITFTPVEMITALIDAVDLPQRIKRWSEQESRRRSLDALRHLAREYATQRREAGAPVTLTGLRAELDATEEGADLSSLSDAVWVGTVHQAKGLEWKHVVTMLRGVPKPRNQAHGVLVSTPGAVDIARPLDDRTLRYWPLVCEHFGPLQDRLAASPFALTRTRAEADESGRLHYVALTRAAETSVLSVPTTPTILDSLTPTEHPLLTWGEAGIAVRGQREPLAASIVVTDVDAERDPVLWPAREDPLAATDIPLRPGIPLRPEVEEPTRRSARFQASAVTSEDALGVVAAPRPIGPALVPGGGECWERVGEAVHAYLALPLPQLDTTQRTAAAERLVQRWAVSRAVDASVLQQAGHSWWQFLAAEFSGAAQLTEQPITWRNEDAQVMEGWIDTLLRLPDGGIVLVDHKTYPGTDPVGHVRRHYLGQMATYSRALAAAGLRPDRILIHLPLRGEVLEVTLHELAA